MESNHYIYCPFCATELERRPVFDRIRPTCPNCHFIHFRDPKVGVVAVVSHRGRILLVQRGVEPARGDWALPGGYMDPGEMPDEAVRREFREEVNLEIEIRRLLDIYPMADERGNSRGIVLAYEATAVDSSTPLCTGDDVIAAGWFAPHEIPPNLAFESTRTLLETWKQGHAAL